MRGYLWASVVFGAVLAAGLPASGALYTVPLEGLQGVYSTPDSWQPSLDWGPKRRTATFDVGFGFERVDSIRIHVVGTIAPALFREWRPPREVIIHSDGSVERVGEREWEATPSINFYSPLPGGSYLLNSVAPTGTFDSEVELYRSTLDSVTQTWNSVPGLLAQGGGEVELSLWQGVLPEWGGQVVPSVAGISDVYLVIDGVAVPEPSSAWVVGAAIAVLVTRRARRIAVR